MRKGRSRFFIRRISELLKGFLLSDNSPHKVAGGLALGVFLGLFPTFGIGGVAAVGIAHILRLNKAAALAGLAILNPLTYPIFYPLFYIVGMIVTGTNLDTTIEGIKKLAVGEVAVVYIAGNIVVSSVMSVITYFVSLRIARSIVRRRHRHLE